MIHLSRNVVKIPYSKFWIYNLDGLSVLNESSLSRLHSFPTLSVDHLSEFFCFSVESYSNSNSACLPSDSFWLSSLFWFSGYPFAPLCHFFAATNLKVIFTISLHRFISCIWFSSIFKFYTHRTAFFKFFCWSQWNQVHEKLSTLLFCMYLELL